MSTARADFGAGTRPMLDVLVREVAARLDAAAGLDADRRLSALQLCEVVAACAIARFHPGEHLLRAVLQEATAHLHDLPAQARIHPAICSAASLDRVVSHPVPLRRSNRICAPWIAIIVLVHDMESFGVG